MKLSGKYRRWMWAAPLFMVAGITLIGLAITGLWNWLMPALFGLSAITFWQVIGLALLARLILLAVSGHRYRRAHHRIAYAHCYARRNHSYKKDGGEQTIAVE